MLPVWAGSIIFKKCDAKNELEHENDEINILKLAVLMQKHISRAVLNNLLKALWGGHTAAHQFMLGRQLQVGERRHAIQSRRLEETTSWRYVYAGIS